MRVATLVLATLLRSRLGRCCVLILRTEKLRRTRMRALTTALLMAGALAGERSAAANPARHSAGAQGLGALVAHDLERSWWVGSAWSIRGLSSRLQGPSRTHLLVTRGEGLVEVGAADRAQGRSGYALARGSLAMAYQLYRVIPLALHVEDMELAVSKDSRHARFFLGTGASVPIDILLSLDGEHVLLASAFVGLWRRAPARRDLRWSQGVRADYLGPHLGASVWWIFEIDGSDRQQKRLASLFARDMAAIPLRVGMDVVSESGGLGERVSAFVAWGFAP